MNYKYYSESTVIFYVELCFSTSDDKWCAMHGKPHPASHRMALSPDKFNPLMGT